MPLLKAAGVRIPEDLAIIGFDDIADAESADPPLTTVRQRFEMMGSAACDLLASMIAGEAFPAEGVRTANTLAVRSSCGCNTIQEFLDKEDAAPEEDAGGVLARQMVELLLLPRAACARAPADRGMAGGHVLDRRAISRRFEGAALPSAAELGVACRQAVDITMDVGTLLAAIRLLGQFHERRGGSLDDTARRRVEAFLEASRLAIGAGPARGRESSCPPARGAREDQLRCELGPARRHPAGDAVALVVETTTVVWGCLALWMTRRRARASSSPAPTAATAARPRRSAAAVGRRRSAGGDAAAVGRGRHAHGAALADTLCPARLGSWCSSA